MTANDATQLGGTESAGERAAMNQLHGPSLWWM